MLTSPALFAAIYRAAIGLMIGQTGAERFADRLAFPQTGGTPSRWRASPIPVQGIGGVARRDAEPDDGPSHRPPPRRRLSMTPFPAFTWEELSRQVNDLAAADVRMMVPHLMSAARKLSPQTHPGLSDMSVFAIAAVLLDNDFRPHLSPEIFAVETGQRPSLGAPRSPCPP